MPYSNPEDKKRNYQRNKKWNVEYHRIWIKHNREWANQYSRIFTKYHPEYEEHRKERYHNDPEYYERRKQHDRKSYWKNRDSRLAYNRDRYNYNYNNPEFREKESKRKHNDYKNKPELRKRILERNTRYRKDPLNKEVFKKSGKKWRLKNPNYEKEWKNIPEVKKHIKLNRLRQRIFNTFKITFHLILDKEWLNAYHRQLYAKNRTHCLERCRQRRIERNLS